MFDELLRPWKERALYSVSKKLGKYISPNIMTLLSLILGLVSVFFILQQKFFIALIFWFFNRFFDGLDGTIARVTNRQTDLGGYFDILADFLLYALIPVFFVYSRGLIRNEVISLMLMLSVFYLNAASWMYLSSIIEKRNNKVDKKLTSVHMPSGLIEGFETIIVYTLFYFLPNNILLLFIIMSLLTFIGIMQRIFWAIRNLN